MECVCTLLLARIIYLLFHSLNSILIWSIGLMIWVSRHFFILTESIHLSLLLYYIFIFDSGQALLWPELVAFAILTALLGLYRILYLPPTIISHLERILLLNDLHGMLQVDSERLLKQPNYTPITIERHIRLTKWSWRRVSAVQQASI